MNRIEVILFGLTGFGTELIQELLKYDLKININLIIITVKQ